MSFLYILSLLLLHPTIAPSPTDFPTKNPSTNPTKNPSLNPTETPSFNPTNPSVDPSLNPTLNPSVFTISPTETPTFHPSVFTISPSEHPSLTPSITPSVNPTSNPSANTVDPSETPSLNPTINTASPSEHPSLNPSLTPSLTPTITPSAQTVDPSQTPSVNPTIGTSSPSLFPSITPSINPTKNPSHFPSENPTLNPSLNPTKNPSNNPTLNPSSITSAPTQNPTDLSGVPTLFPTVNPSVNPTSDPTNNPSLNPSSVTTSPTNSPTNTPTDGPSDSPTNSPTNAPTYPTDAPTNTPTNSPTNAPTYPTNAPTDTPTNGPTNSPSNTPTNGPTNTPSNSPTNGPTDTPSNTPTNGPTNSPSRSPTDSPSSSPTDGPTNTPSNSPTNGPSNTPSNSPTNSPTPVTLAPTLGATKINSYSSDWILSANPEPHNATKVKSPSIFNSIVYINTICKANSDYLSTKLLLNNLTSGFEIGFMHPKCVFSLAENKNITLGIGTTNTWCNNDYSTGYTLLSNGNIRYNNIEYIYNNTISNIQLNEITDIEMVVSYQYDSIEYILNDESFGTFNLTTKPTLNLEDEFPIGIRAVIGSNSDANGNVILSNFTCHNSSIGNTNNNINIINETICLEPICTSNCKPNCNITNGTIQSNILIDNSDTLFNDSIVKELEISLVGTHEYQSDLNISLFHKGVNFLILDDVGRKSTDFNFIASDEGATIIPTTTDLNCGGCKLHPETGNLNTAFNTSSPVGVWSLEIKDSDSGVDHGQLSQFCIQTLCYFDTRDTIPVCNETCQSYVWEYINDADRTNGSYEVIDIEFYGRNQFVNISINNRPCIDGNISISIASTDFDNKFEFLDIGIGTKLFNRINPNNDNTCEVDYMAVDKFSVGNIQVGELYPIMFVLSEHRINKNEGCNNHSFKARIDLECDGTVTLAPTVDTVSPTKFPTLNPVIGTPSPTTAAPTQACEACQNDYLLLSNDEIPYKTHVINANQDNSIAKDHHIYITFTDRPCRAGANISINAANTDFDGVDEYFTYSIGNATGNGTICNPGTESLSCDTTKNCVNNFTTIYDYWPMDNQLDIFFEMGLDPINIATGCAQFSVVFEIVITCYTQTDAPSLSPSIVTVNPTLTPTKEPTKIPTDSPTNTPTNSPSNAPTDSPSDSPSNSPSDSPSNAPTATPSDSPSNSPTNAPTSNPVASPSDSPTNTPSFSPSGAPTAAPSKAPSLAPTNAPTRPPTESDPVFDGYLSVSFEFYNVSDKTISFINTNIPDLSTDNYDPENVTVLNKLEEIIEMNYWTQIRTSPIYDNYNYSQFDVIITYINDIHTNNEGQRHDTSSSSSTVIRRRLLVTGTNQFTIEWEMWIQKRYSQVADLTTNEEEFKIGITNGISEYFNDSGLAYTSNSLLAISYNKLDVTETFLESLLSDEFLFINILYIFAAILVQFIAVLHVKLQWIIPNKTDHFKTKDFLTFALQIWDLFSDLLFARTVYRIYNENPRNLDISIIYFGSITFIFVPWILNVTHVLRESKDLQNVVQDNPQAKRWFRKRRKFLAWLVALTGGLYPSLRLVCSRMFGLNILDFSLSSREIDAFESVKLKYTVLFENLPQFILQIFFLIIEPQAAREVSTWLAIVSSVLSMLSVLFGYCLTKGESNLSYSRYIITIDYSDPIQYKLIHSSYPLNSKQECHFCKCKYGIHMTSDIKQMYHNRLMQTRLLKNIIHNVLGFKCDLEIVCVVIGKKKSQIIIDYSSSVGDISLLQIFSNKQKELSECIKYSFEMSNVYPITFAISQKRWKIEKLHFVEKFLTQQTEQQQIHNTNDGDLLNNKSTRKLTFKEDKFGKTTLGLSLGGEESVSIHGERYDIIIRRKDSKSTPRKLKLGLGSNESIDIISKNDSIVALSDNEIEMAELPIKTRHKRDTEWYKKHRNHRNNLDTIEDNSEEKEGMVEDDDTTNTRFTRKQTGIFIHNKHFNTLNHLNNLFEETIQINGRQYKLKVESYINQNDEEKDNLMKKAVNIITQAYKEDDIDIKKIVKFLSHDKGMPDYDIKKAFELANVNIENNNELKELLNDIKMKYKRASMELSKELNSNEFKEELKQIEENKSEEIEIDDIKIEEVKSDDEEIVNNGSSTPVLVNPTSIAPVTLDDDIDSDSSDDNMYGNVNERTLPRYRTRKNIDTKIKSKIKNKQFKVQNENETKIQDEIMLHRYYTRDDDNLDKDNHAIPTLTGARKSVDHLEVSKSQIEESKSDSSIPDLEQPEVSFKNDKTMLSKYKTRDPKDKHTTMKNKIKTFKPLENNSNIPTSPRQIQKYKTRNKLELKDTKSDEIIEMEDINSNTTDITHNITDSINDSDINTALEIDENKDDTKSPEIPTNSSLDVNIVPLKTHTRKETHSLTLELDKTPRLPRDSVFNFKDDEEQILIQKAVKMLIKAYKDEKIDIYKIIKFLKSKNMSDKNIKTAFLLADIELPLFMTASFNDDDNIMSDNSRYDEYSRDSINDEYSEEEIIPPQHNLHEIRNVNSVSNFSSGPAGLKNANSISNVIIDDMTVNNNISNNNETNTPVKSKLKKAFTSIKNIFNQATIGFVDDENDKDSISFYSDDDSLDGQQL